MTAPASLTIRRPDDWHVHLRDGAVHGGGAAVHRAAVCAGDRDAQPLAAGDYSAQLGREYRERIVAAMPPGLDFTPLMTAYLTDATDPAI